MLPNSPFHLTFLLFGGFSNMVLASAIEPLRVARDLSGKRLFSWQTCSVYGDAVPSSSRITVNVDLPLERVGATDALVIVSGYGMRGHVNAAVATMIRRKARGLPVIAGFDTGTWLLARLGLLTGRTATIHWMERNALAEDFPEVSLGSGSYATDGNIVTCGDAQSVLNWTLDLIARRSDDALRYDVANMFGHAGSAHAPGGSSLPDRMSDLALPPALQRAIALMRETAEQPMTLIDIARRTALSPRSMDRLFHRQLGMAPGKYYQKIRLSHARALAIETELSLADIASRTGFTSPSTLARAYRRAFGETVRQTSIGKL